MPTLALDSFPAGERTRLARALARCNLHPGDVTITKSVFPPASMPGGICEMVTIVHGLVSRSYACRADADWISAFTEDLGGAKRPRRRPARAPAARAGRTRLLGAAAAHGDDVQVLQAIRAIAQPEVEADCAFRAAILNEAGRPYREVDLHSLLETMRLTAALNASGFRRDAAKREGRSKRYDWYFTKDGEPAPGRQPPSVRGVSSGRAAAPQPARSRACTSHG